MYYGLSEPMFHKSMLRPAPVECTYHRELAVGDVIFVGDHPPMTVMSRHRNGIVWEYQLWPLEMGESYEC